MTEQESRKELHSEMLRCGNDCGKSECLALCKSHEWFACEYHNDSRNCVAVLGPVDPENTIIPPLSEEQGLCFLNRNKILFKFS